MAFQPPLGFTPRTGPLQANTNKILGMAGDAVNAYQSLNPDMKAGLSGFAKTAAQQTRKFAGQRSVMNAKGGRKNLDDFGGSSGKGGGYGLSPAPNPMPVSLNTGIKPNTYTSDYMDAVENDCSPLHISAASLTLANDSSQKLTDYWTNILSYEIQTRAQNAVSFNLNISTLLTSANLRTCFNTLLEALQVYYWYASIITYHSDAKNKNEGMIYLRTQLTAQNIEDILNLKRKLTSMPIPPNMLKVVRYLASNYYSGDTQGSPIIKIAPYPLLGTGLDPQHIPILTNGLTATSTYSEVWSLIRRAIPEWSISSLPDVPLNPVFDKDFQTIFANLPFTVWYGSAIVRYPTVASEDTPIAYCSFSNDLDGFAYALCSAFKTGSSNIMYPGLMKVQNEAEATAGFNRKSYYEISGVKKLWDIGSATFLNRARAETYYVSNTTNMAVSNCHLSGTDKCKGVTPNTIKETAFKALDYLFSLETLKSMPLKRSNSSGPRNKRN